MKRDQGSILSAISQAIISTMDASLGSFEERFGHLRELQITLPLSFSSHLFSLFRTFPQSGQLKVVTEDISVSLNEAPPLLLRMSFFTQLYFFQISRVQTWMA